MRPTAARRLQHATATLCQTCSWSARSCRAVQVWGRKRWEVVASRNSNGTLSAKGACWGCAEAAGNVMEQLNRDAVVLHRPWCAPSKHGRVIAAHLEQAQQGLGVGIQALKHASPHVLRERRAQSSHCGGLPRVWLPLLDSDPDTLRKHTDRAKGGAQWARKFGILQRLPKNSAFTLALWGWLVCCPSNLNRPRP